MLIDRTVSGRPWRLLDADPARTVAIAQQHGLPEIVARVLAARSIEPAAVPLFLEPRLKDCLPDPSHLLDLDRAAVRLAAAVQDREPIGIIGDYDVDGASSAALMVRWCRCFGIEPKVEIPDRLTDGYGANAAAFDRLAEANCRLVLTLDNGTTAFAALAHAHAQGQQVIVVDHHAAEAKLPKAVAIVNPNRQDQDSPLGHLAAVGITFVLLAAVQRELRRRAPSIQLPDLLTLLDLVALGTVCDVVALHGLNRAFVRQGLKVTAHGGTPGLRALAACAGLTEIDDSWHLGFVLGPRINAGGRLGEPLLGTRLLTANDAAEADALAARLDRLNKTRQQIERDVLAWAEQSITGQLDTDAPVLVAAGEAWHVGVLGIVASRLVERHGRPAFVIGLDRGVGKGSGRSVPGVDLGALVIAARRDGLLDRAGGHAMAAGLTVDSARLPAFTAFARDYVASASTAPQPLERSPVELDGAVSVAGVDVTLARSLQRLAPFGPGNREPRFRVDDARIIDARVVGSGHVSCVLAGSATGRARAIAFRAADQALGRALLSGNGAPVRLAGHIRLDRYRGELRASFRIDDLAP